VVAGLGDPRGQPEPAAFAYVEELDLVHVEAQFVQPADPLADAVPLLLRPQHLRAGELGPERFISAGQVLDGLDRVEVLAEKSTCLQVEQFAAHPLLGHQYVVLTLPVRKGRMDLGGLGIHEVGRQRTRVQPEQRVRQRAVAPHEAGQVQSDEKFDLSVEQTAGQVLAAWIGKQGAVGGGEVEESRDQNGVEILTAVDDDAQDLDGRDAQFAQLTQELILPAREPLVNLLECEHFSRLGDEAHDMPGQSALGYLDQSVIHPLRQRLPPRESQQPGGGLGWGAEQDAHRRPLL